MLREHLTLRTLAFSVCLAFLAHAGANAACRVEQRGEAALDWSRGVPVVSAAGNGSGTAFVLDTGAARSVLDEAAVERLSLPLDEWAAMTVRGVGGVVRHGSRICAR